MIGGSKVDDKLIDFKLCIDELGGFDMDSLDGRIMVQKKIYLLQLCGLDLGYRFNWYIRGPYSPSLADSAFEVWNTEELVSQITEEYELEDECIDQLNKIKGLINSKSPFSELEDFQWLELLASVHYLRHIAYMPGFDNQSKDEICKKINQLKPYFIEDHINKAWEILDQWGLIERDTLE